MISINKILGFRFDSLEEAKELVNPGYVVITDNDETFFIVHQETFMQGLYQLGYSVI